MKHKLERQRSRSINELAFPLPSCHTHHDAENDATAQQRRVQSGPKERTTPEPAEETDERIASAKSGERQGVLAMVFSNALPKYESGYFQYQGVTQANN